MSMAPPEKSGYPPINRFITTHREDGKAVFSTDIPEEAPQKYVPNDMFFTLSYTTKTFPVEMSKDADLPIYQNYLNDAPGLTVSGGTVLRHVDFGPGLTCAMHRTVSLDYGVLLEGSIECILDSGERRTMKRGDVCIQRGTMHAWRNPSDTEWARMMFVLQPCKELEFEGKKYGEDITENMGVRRSD